MEFDASRFKLIVVKAGTSVLTDGNGLLDPQGMERIVDGIASLWKQGRSVVFVTSGAVAGGMARLGMKTKPREVSVQQSCAAIGQPALMSEYDRLFSKHGIVIAQVLLTNDDFVIRGRYLDMMSTIQELLGARVVPVINENDVVSHRELLADRGSQAVFDDNDELAALLASKMRANMLILLTDVDGLYDSNPKKNSESALIRQVARIGQREELAAGKASATGRGGMRTKLSATGMATSSGVWVAIANGKKPGIIASVLAQREGTLFQPSETGLSGKEQWLAFASHVSGSIYVNARACEALLKKGASLLAVGVVSASGSFKRGEVVDIVCGEERVARGKVNYSSEELLAIAGKKSDEIRRLLGRSDEVIAREDLVMLGKGA
jgi:glutamate 5-kinase